MTALRARRAPAWEADGAAGRAESKAAPRKKLNYRSILLSLSPEAKERVLRPVHEEVAGVLNGFDERD